METFKLKPIYKVKEPYSTINEVRNTLFECDIFLKETAFHQSVSDTDAAELRFADRCFKDIRIATNGKGMNPRYAMASAYAEMMERLQSGFLLEKYTAYAFANNDISFKWGPDEKMIPADETFRDCRDMLISMFELGDEEFNDALSRISGKEILCIPFYNYFEKKVQYIPYDMLCIFTSSNGLCAGNNAKEAIAQGISELYERQALALIFRDNAVLPKMRRELFDNTSVKNKLEGLETLGYEVDIIDASMGLDYPVIGLRVMTDYGLMFNLGADPNPVVALERCLTEMYQLTSEDSLKRRACSESSGTRAACRNFIEEDFYHHQLIRSKHIGSGDKPDNVFYPSNVYSQEYTYNDEMINDFDYLVGLTEKLGYQMYIRDCSYLGFPSYSIIIPEISLGDYYTKTYFKIMIKMICEGVDYKRPEAYDNMLKIIRNLHDRYQSNMPGLDLGEVLKREKEQGL